MLLVLSNISFFDPLRNNLKQTDSSLKQPTLLQFNYNYKSHEETTTGKEVVVSMESITERLSHMENLYFPRAQQSSALEPSQRKSILQDLYSRDLPVFLERYGSLLTLDELKEFDTLSDNYEINWHLNHLRTLINPTSEDLKSRSAKVKNRRRAFMDKLMYDGKFFSEDSMRDREPYLHHEFVGKFQDQTGRQMSRPGERWSETLLRRAEEAVLVDKIRREQQRLGVDEREWVENEPQQEEEEEEEEEEDDDDDDVEDGNDKGNLVNERSGSVAGASLSVDEMEDRMEQFTNVMQQKFLAGEDHQHFDYSSIDDDVTLDDHWVKEATYDAEEKYFADV